MAHGPSVPKSKSVQQERRTGPNLGYNGKPGFRHLEVWNSTPAGSI